ncbi:hypothetical protein VTK73DRAFT_2136 [Phialemonium thermophilum]|uniref:Uncharacterized protein n=1 Tax=Phialemonium thermophilum TaxID=223376 RepID=A0ABR3X6B8_9PEZI
MRRSRTIFRFVAPLPGDRWDDDYMDAMPEVYEASKAAARRATAGADSRSACHRYPTAKVQIVLWPELQRWSPLGRIGFADEDKDDGRYPTETSDFVGGKTVSTIMKSQVVYYAGNADSEEARPEAISSLRQHARAIKRNRLRRKAVPFLCLFALVIVSVLLLFWRTRVIAWIGKTTEGMSNRMSSIDVEKEKIEPDDPPAFARRAVRRSVDWAYIRESLKRLLMRPFRGGHAWNQ